MDAQDAIYVKAFGTIAGRGATVALGRAVQDNDLLTQMRALDVGSTVDSAGSTAARINVPLAIATELTEKHIALGSQHEARRHLVPVSNHHGLPKHQLLLPGVRLEG